MFDRNDLVVGSAITHANNTAAVTLGEPGVYVVLFHGTFSTTPASSVPAALTLYLQQDGSPAPGLATQHTFQTVQETANLSMSGAVSVSSAPSTLEVVGAGTDFLYSVISITVYRLGDAGN